MSTDLNESLQLTKVGNFKFSTTKLEDLGADSYTLATIVIDLSGSTSPYIKDMEKALKEIINACLSAPRADNLLVRLLVFSDDVQEIHGFKLLSSINVDDYTNVLKPGGMTALYDACENSIRATNIEGRRLLDKDYAVNGYFIVITDGADNRSVVNMSSVKKALDEAVTGENMESMFSILVEVNPNGDASLQRYLDDFFNSVGFTQKEVLKDLTAKGFAKLANFISKSISSQSQAIGSGGPSQKLTF